MSPRLTQLLEEMAPQEQAEVEAFAAFVLVRRHLQQPALLTNDIAVQELTERVAASGSLDWLSAEAEDIYSVVDTSNEGDCQDSKRHDPTLPNAVLGSGLF